jgi:hypothetical protein
MLLESTGKDGREWKDAALVLLGHELCLFIVGLGMTGDGPVVVNGGGGGRKDIRATSPSTKLSFSSPSSLLGLIVTITSDGGRTLFNVGDKIVVRVLIICESSSLDKPETSDTSSSSSYSSLS